MSTNPPSLRLPFTPPNEALDENAKVHPQVMAAIRYLFNGVTDLESAIPVLKASIPAATTPTAATTVNAPNVVGSVNDQTGQASVALQNSDYGAAVVVNNAAGVALALNPVLNRPFYAHILNQGSGVATLTPSTGTINGASSYSLAGGANVHIYFDSASGNWTAG